MEPLGLVFLSLEMGLAWMLPAAAVSIPRTLAQEVCPPLCRSEYVILL